MQSWDKNSASNDDNLEMIAASLLCGGGTSSTIKQQGGRGTSLFSQLSFDASEGKSSDLKSSINSKEADEGGQLPRFRSVGGFESTGKSVKLSTKNIKPGDILMRYYEAITLSFGGYVGGSNNNSMVPKSLETSISGTCAVPGASSNSSQHQMLSSSSSSISTFFKKKRLLVREEDADNAALSGDLLRSAAANLFKVTRVDHRNAVVEGTLSHGLSHTFFEPANSTTSSESFSSPPPMSKHVLVSSSSSNNKKVTLIKVKLGEEVGQKGRTFLRRAGPVEVDIYTRLCNMINDDEVKSMLVQSTKDKKSNNCNNQTNVKDIMIGDKRPREEQETHNKTEKEEGNTNSISLKSLRSSAVSGNNTGSLSHHSESQTLQMIVPNMVVRYVPMSESPIASSQAPLHGKQLTSYEITTRDREARQSNNVINGHGNNTTANRDPLFGKKFVVISVSKGCSDSSESPPSIVLGMLPDDGIPSTTPKSSSGNVIITTTGNNIETVVPRAGQQGLVLSGPYAGEIVIVNRRDRCDVSGDPYVLVSIDDDDQSEEGKEVRIEAADISLWHTLG
eukprot:Tbor_TRINITY_DN4314_c0_g1::TRINITY_DN4314_c0_g1_i1::g.7795::m.7795